MEAKLLKLFLVSRFSYDKLRNLLNLKEFSPVGETILGAIDKYYSLDQKASQVDVELLKNSIVLNLPPKQQTTIVLAVDSVLGTELSEENIISYVLDVKKSAIGQELSAKLLSGNEQEIQELITQYTELDIEKLDPDKEVIYHNTPVEEILEASSDKYKIPIYPASLNKVLEGGCYPGQNVLIFGRPEIGKTLFVINLIFGFAKSGFTTLYIGNEDPARQLLPRFLTRFSGITKGNLGKDLKATNEAIQKNGYANFIFKEASPGSFFEIKTLIQNYKPQVIVIDQLRNIQAPKMDRVNQLEYLATTARTIAKHNNVLCVSVTQAGNSALNKRVLDMGDVDYSNTGIPGQMDLMIGIGADDNDLNRNWRVLSLCKNKISGDHGFYPVQYNVQLNKVTSI